jgi:uncharacterized membrane protein YcgQ (UPF0703/DUF1980 family)
MNLFEETGREDEEHKKHKYEESPESRAMMTKLKGLPLITRYESLLKVFDKMKTSVESSSVDGSLSFSFQSLMLSEAYIDTIEQSLLNLDVSLIFSYEETKKDIRPKFSKEEKDAYNLYVKIEQLTLNLARVLDEGRI